MNKKKAVICTILFAIIIWGIFIAMALAKPHESQMSWLHIFSPAVVGWFISERVEMFYKWLTKNN